MASGRKFSYDFSYNTETGRCYCADESVQEMRIEAVYSLEQNVFVLSNNKSRMKGDLHVRFREKSEMKVFLLTRLRVGAPTARWGVE